MINNQGIRDSIRQKVNNDIIMKYLFIKSIEGQYGDEYIKTKYRINPATIRSLYKGLNQEERMSLEEEIKKQIDDGKIDLKKEAIIWHKESLGEARAVEIGGKNITSKREER